MNGIRLLSNTLILFTAFSCNPFLKDNPAASLTSTPSVYPSGTPTFTPSRTPISTYIPTVTRTKCSPQPITETHTKTPTTKPNSSVPALSIWMIKNATFDLPFYGTVIFTDGVWKKDSVYLELVEHAFGDLNNDGVIDAAVSLAQNLGGSMWIETILIFLNLGGEPVLSGYRDLAEGTGRVYFMSIRRGQIELKESLHGPNDCNHCFSIRAVEIMQYFPEGHLVQRRLSTTRLPDQDERQIDITSPAEGMVVSCSIILQGKVSDYTEEKFMYYSIWSIDYKVLAFGSLDMETDGKNAGGAFNGVIDLTKIKTGQNVMLSVYEADFKITSPDPFIDSFVQYISAADSVVLYII